MKNFFVFNEGFSKSKTSSYILSLQLDEQGYSYAIIDIVGKTYAALNHHNFEKKLAGKSIAEKAEAMIQEDLFLSKNYKTVYFSYITQKSTLIPAEFFDKKKAKEYFIFNHKLGENEELLFNYNKKIDAYNVFSISSDLTTILVNKFPEIIFVHQNNFFINNLIAKGEATKFKLPVVHINVNSDTFNIGIYKDDKFVMHNTYKYADQNDFVYYLMNTLKQYGIEQNKMHINVSGLIEKKSDFLKFVKDFFPNLKFLSLDTKLKYNFKDIGQHILYNILNMYNEDY